MIAASGTATVHALGEILAAHVLETGLHVSLPLLGSRVGINHRTLARALVELPEAMAPKLTTFARAFDGRPLVGLPASWLVAFAAVNPSKIPASLRPLHVAARAT